MDDKLYKLVYEETLRLMLNLEKNPFTNRSSVSAFVDSISYFVDSVYVPYL